MWTLTTPYTPGDTHSRSCPWATCARRGHADGGGPGERATVLSPLPAGAAVGMRAVEPLEAQDERAAGRPWAHAGAQDAASSSWTPGSSGLLPPSFKPVFPVQGTPGAEGPQRSEHTCREDTLIHTHLGFVHISQIPKLISVCHPCIVVPCWFPPPIVSAHNPPWLPYCLERSLDFPP